MMLAYIIDYFHTQGRVGLHLVKENSNGCHPCRSAWKFTKNKHPFSYCTYQPVFLDVGYMPTGLVIHLLVPLGVFQMKKLVPVFVALFVGAGFVGAVSAADAAAPGSRAAICQKKAEDKKLTGEKAAKYIAKCEKKK